MVSDEINSASKFMNRVDRTRSSIIKGLIKRWNSSKELFKSNSNASPTATSPPANPAPQSTDTSKNYDRVLNSLDEFERNFLLSANRKVSVKELRKNFEVAAESAESASTKAQPIAAPAASHPNAGDAQQAKRLPLHRHSFYNTYRNEYCASSTDLYSSNISLNIYSDENRPSNKTFTKQFNKYVEFIKSSSTIDLSTSCVSYVECSDAKRSANGIRNPIQPNKLTRNECDVRELSAIKSSLSASPAAARRKCSNIKRVYSANNLSSTEQMLGYQRPTFDTTYPNDTQSLIVSMTYDDSYAIAEHEHLNENVNFNGNDEIRDTHLQLNDKRLRNYNSANQIFLDVLKKELNCYIDRSNGSGDVVNGFSVPPSFKRFKKVSRFAFADLCLTLLFSHA